MSTMHRRLALVSMPLVLAISVGACGDDDDERQAPRAAFELAGSGDQAKMSGPTSVEAGAVRIDFRNTSDDDAGVTLIRIQGDHTAAEAVEAAEAWGDGDKPLPAWVRFAGGVFSIDPGARSTSVQELSAGRYAAVDVNTNAYVAFEATGDGAGELPATTGRIEAKDYSFETSGSRRARGASCSRTPANNPTSRSRRRSSQARRSRTSASRSRRKRGAGSRRSSRRRALEAESSTAVRARSSS